MRDPIVEEVRKYRMEHTQKFGGNLAAICADLRSVQEASGHEVVRLPAKRVEPNETAGGVAKRRRVQ
ncbi:MAG: hypothetical protein EHM23_22050 [Acidobacteria bacterium]|nr:MAG: hypothetical protein EHM23_22050 [Acidobacteriota bacterium]